MKKPRQGLFHKFESRLCSLLSLRRLFLCCLLCLSFLCHLIVFRDYCWNKLLLTSVAEKSFQDFSALVLIILLTIHAHNSIDVLCVDN